MALSLRHFVRVFYLNVMDKSQIASRLIDAHQFLIAHVNGLSREEYEFSKDGVKWNAGQEVLHIIKSVKALNRALSMPKMALKLTFGKSNRPTRSYEEVVTKYQTKLASDKIVTTPPFEPDRIAFAQRDDLNTTLMSKVDQLNSLLDRFSE